MKKTFVIDTNIPMTDSLCLERFEEHDIIIPKNILNELDNNIQKGGEAGENCLKFLDYLDKFGKEVYEGVKTVGGGVFKVVDCDQSTVNLVKENTSMDDIHDMMILATVLEQEKEKDNVVLVTRDTYLRICAREFDVETDNFRGHIKIEKDFKGYRLVIVDEVTMKNFYTSKYKTTEATNTENAYFAAPNLAGLCKELGCYDNEYIILLEENELTEEIKSKILTDELDYESEFVQNLVKEVHLPILKVKMNSNGNPTLHHLITLNKFLHIYKIYPKNAQQEMMIDLLADKDTIQKTVTGVAGTGKTLLALLVGLIKKDYLKEYDEIYVTRPPVETEYSLGFLPGTELEKLEPFLQGFVSNLRYIKKKKDKNYIPNPEWTVEEELSKDGIFAKSMSHMRGDTYHRVYFIKDESQNSTGAAAKTTLTRIGEESSAILLGDISQIDYSLVDKNTNGLTHAVEIMKGDKIAGHITLEVSERSDYAKKISEKWDTRKKPKKQKD